MRGARIFVFFVIQITALLISGCEWNPKILTGYVEGRLSFISSSRSGSLSNLLVRRGESVVIGQKLFTLEEQPESDIVKQYQADIVDLLAKQEQAKANLAHLKLVLERRETLAITNAISQEDLDTSRVAKKNAIEELNSIEARLATSQAKLNEVKWQKAEKEVHAEKAGVVFDTYFVPAEFIAAGQPVLSILSKKDKYLVFYVPGYLLHKFIVNQKVQVTCDQAKTPFEATISFIYPKAEFAPPIIYSDKSRTSLMYKVEADVDNDANYGCLHIGQPVDIILKD